MRQDTGHGLVLIVRDTHSLTDQAEDIDTTLSEETKAAARRVVCANAVDDQGQKAVTEENLAELVADAGLLMTVLGVFPGQEVDQFTVGGIVKGEMS